MKGNFQKICFWWETFLTSNIRVYSVIPTPIFFDIRTGAGIFADIGGFILGIGNSLITNVLEMFGVNFHPYDSAGAWVLGKLNEVWDGLKTWFTGLGEKWPLLGSIGSWVLEKVTGAF